MQFTRLTEKPVPVWTTAVDTEKYGFEPPFSGFDLLTPLGLPKRWLVFRSVSIDRLPTILTSGIDVEPTTDPIYVDDFDKSWEYGGWPKVTMALDPKRLDRTFREIAADTPAEEIARLMEDYPTRIDSEDGESIWLTRLLESDTRAASAYERSYGYWIPGNPFFALIAVFVFMPESQAA